MNRTISRVAVFVLMSTTSYTMHVYPKSTTTTTVQTQNIQPLTGMDALNRLVKKSTKPVVVKVFATWCNACKNTKPHYAAVAAELGDKFVFTEANVDTFVDKEELNAPGIPTFIVYKNGVEAGRFVGGTDAKGIKAELARITQ